MSSEKKALESVNQPLTLGSTRSKSDSTVSINMIIGEDHYDGNASSLGSIINISNNIFGSGLLTLPYIFRMFSFFPAIIVITCVFFLSLFSFILLAKTCNMTRQYNYRDMCTILFGKAWGYVVQVIMLLYATGSCIAYATVIGDNFVGVFQNFFPDIEFLHTRVYVVCLIILLFIFPISFFKNLNGLKFTSFLALIGVGICISVTIIEECNFGQVNSTVKWFDITASSFSALPMICVAFNTHYNAPRYYYELKDRSIPKLRYILLCSFGIGLLFYIIIGIAGYLQFGVEAQGNILLNYDIYSIFATLGRLGMGICIVFSYPLAYMSVRNSLHILVFPNVNEESILYRLLCSVFIISITVFLSLVIGNIETIVGFNGSLFGGIIVFVIPGFLYIDFFFYIILFIYIYYLFRYIEAKKAITDNIWTSVNIYIAILSIIIGIATCIGGTYLQIMKLIN
ncbi:hypothetical protein WA158_005320 [Blastocystis sp. Blastoise]